MSAILHAVWPRTPGTRLRLRPAAIQSDRRRHVVEMLSRCAGLTPSAIEPLDVVYVHLPGGDDLFRLATRTGGRLGPTGCVPGLRVHARGAAAAGDFADLAVVTLGPDLSGAEARAAARLARELACRRVLFVLASDRHADASARSLAEACRSVVPHAAVDVGSFGRWNRRPDFVTVTFDHPPHHSQALVA